MIEQNFLDLLRAVAILVAEARDLAPSEPCRSFIKRMLDDLKKLPPDLWSPEEVERFVEGVEAFAEGEPDGLDEASEIVWRKLWIYN